MVQIYSKKSVGAVIVTYNPDLNLLQKNIESIHCQVAKVVVVDNASNNCLGIQQLCSRFADVSCVFLGENKGIAAAQNIGFSKLERHGCLWGVLLDQDSEFMQQGVEKYLLELNKRHELSIGMVTPRYIDRNSNESVVEDYAVFEVEFPIASGSMVNVPTWRSIGGMDETLFIDRVDDDFDIRLRQAGYKLLQVSSVRLIHNIGDIGVVNIGPFRISVFHHNEFRKYYIARNAILYFKKHGGGLDVVKRVTTLIVKVLLFEQDKFAKISSIYAGIGDGLANRGGKRS